MAVLPEPPNQDVHASQSQRDDSWRLIGYACTHPDPPLRRAFLPLERLTVLLGPNDSGKSSLLRAIERDLSGGHFDEVDRGVARQIGGVFYAMVTDHELMYVTHESAKGRADARGPQAHQYRGRRLPWDAGLWSSRDVEPGDPNSPAAWLAYLGGENHLRTSILDALRDSRVIGLECAGLDQFGDRVWNAYWCLPALDELTVELRIALETSDLPSMRPLDHIRAGRREVHSSIHGDPRHLQIEGAPVPIISLGPCRQVPMPRGLRVPAEFNAIHDAVEVSVTRLLDLVRNGSEDLLPTPKPLPVANRRMRGFPRAMVEADGDALKVSKYAVSVCGFLTWAANDLLPKFISETYRLVVELRPLEEWFDRRPIDIRLHPLQGRLSSPDFSIEHSADGYRLWMQLALLDALKRLNQVEGLISFATDTYESERHFHIAEAGDTVEPMLFETVLDDLLRLATGTPPFDGPLAEVVARPDYASSANGPPEPRLVLLDEPERHLHPRLQRHAASWLGDAAAGLAPQSLVATHSPPFLGLTGTSTLYVQVSRREERTVLQPFQPDDISQLDRIAAAMGFDRGELVTLINVWLVVEGPTDKIVFDTLFPEELYRAGVVVLPLHGTARWQGLLHADALWRLTTAAVAVMFDKITTQRANEMRRMSNEELVSLSRSATASNEVKDLARLLRAAREHCKTVHSIPNPLPDIIFHLDDAILKRHFPRYPGRANALAAWSKDGEKQLDRFLERRYEIKKTPKVLQEVAHAMFDEDIKPKALGEIVDACTQLAPLAATDQPVTSSFSA